MYPFSAAPAPDEALSPLPARLTLRSPSSSAPSSPTPAATHSPRTSISIAPVPVEQYDYAERYDGRPPGGGVSEWGVGGYAGLLARDPRRTTAFSTARVQGADGALLEGGGVAIVGRSSPSRLCAGCRIADGGGWEH